MWCIKTRVFHNKVYKQGPSRQNMADIGTSNYINALKSGKIKEVTMSVSGHRQAVIDQENKCIKCKKALKPYLYKFITNPATKKIEVICADCTIPIKHR